MPLAKPAPRAPLRGAQVYLLDLSEAGGFSSFTWWGNEHQKRWLDVGLVFRKAEEAHAVARAYRDCAASK